MSERDLLPGPHRGALATATLRIEWSSTSDGNGQDDEPFLASPWLVVPAFDGDDGSRPDVLTPALGPSSPSVWFEEYNPNGEGTRADAPAVGGEYQIAVVVSNVGSGPAYDVCIDFLEWYDIVDRDGGRVNSYQVRQVKTGIVLMEGELIVVRSSLWTPTGVKGSSPGDVIVRAYDAFADPYRDTGAKLFVQNDRHLAHRGY